MSERSKIHDRVLTARNTKELMAAYADWAKSYDADLLGEMGYVAPAIATKLLLDNLENKDALVLDAGCGTGIVGEILTREGISTLTGLDYSEEMLEQAGAKGVYKELIQADLMGPLNLSNSIFDALISVGTFTLGHVGPKALFELARVVKPGGLICFTVRDEAWIKSNYRATIDTIEKEGKWRKIEQLDADYILQDGSRCKICLYESCR
jgi:predicted TPR repeat methyltransferase